MTDDDLERLLGDSLRREAARVVPSDRFDAVLAEVQGRPPRRSGWLAAVAAAAVVAVGLGAAWVLGPLDRGVPQPMAPAPTASAGGGPTPVPTAGPSVPTPPVPTPPVPREAPCPTGPEHLALPAYYVATATTVGNLRLERVVEDRPSCGSRIETALWASMRDPGVAGMRSWWNPVGHVSARLQGRTVVIDLPGAAFRDELTAPQASWALEQLTWAALGAAGSADEVAYRRDGGVDLGRAFSHDGTEVVRKRDESVQARTWLDAIDGLRIPAHQPYALTGSAVLRPVSYDVVSTAGEKLASGQAKVNGALDGQGAWAFTILLDLPPGTYEVRAWIKDEQAQGITVVVG